MTNSCDCEQHELALGICGHNTDTATGESEKTCEVCEALGWKECVHDREHTTHFEGCECFQATLVRLRTDLAAAKEGNERLRREVELWSGEAGDNLRNGIDLIRQRDDQITELSAQLTAALATAEKWERMLAGATMLELGNYCIRKFDAEGNWYIFGSDDEPILNQPNSGFDTLPEAIDFILTPDGKEQKEHGV